MLINFHVQGRLHLGECSPAWSEPSRLCVTVYRSLKESSAGQGFSNFSQSFMQFVSRPLYDSE